jgi:hypothetical protein
VGAVECAFNNVFTQPDHTLMAKAGDQMMKKERKNITQLLIEINLKPV